MTPYATTSQLIMWMSTFGSDYTDRNNRELSGRIPAWRQMLSTVPTGRILEVGCNVGWNLTYISEVGDYELFGIEPQDYAVRQARLRSDNFRVIKGDAFAIPFRPDYFDLVFTSGVLIHIHPTDLRRAMDEMYRVSRRYILYVEYDDTTEQEIPYRDHDQALWKRDHRRAWLDAYPDLQVKAHGRWDATNDYDDTGWCLFEKPRSTLCEP